MLKFERKEFKSGNMIVKDRQPKKDEKGKVVKGEFIEGYRTLKPSHNGQKMEFSDEDFVLKNYPAFFKKVK